MRDAGHVQFIELAPEMRPAGRQRQRTTDASGFRKPVIGAPSVDLEQSGVAGEMALHVLAAAAVLEAVGDHGRRLAAEGSIVARIMRWTASAAGPIMQMGERTKEIIMTVVTIGLDTSKSWFQVHGVDEDGQTVLRRKLARKKVLAFFANLPPCTVGLEACGGSHYWARELVKLGLQIPRHAAPLERCLGRVLCW